MKRTILSLAVLVAQAAGADCHLPANFAPKDVDVLAGQVIATLKAQRNVTVCTCDNNGLMALQTEINSRQAINSKNVYSSPEMGYCMELKSE